MVRVQRARLLASRRCRHERGFGVAHLPLRASCGQIGADSRDRWLACGMRLLLADGVVPPRVANAAQYGAVGAHDNVGVACHLCTEHRSSYPLAHDCGWCSDACGHLLDVRGYRRRRLAALRRNAPRRDRIGACVRRHRIRRPLVGGQPSQCAPGHRKSSTACEKKCATCAS